MLHHLRMLTNPIHLMHNLDTIKLNIRQMAPRPFGERLCETIVQNLLGITKSNTLKFDGILNGENCEVKFSRVIPQKKRGGDLLTELSSDDSLHFVHSKSDSKFDCNIQQVKPSCFDVLIYGLIFDDCIKIFKISSDEIQSDSKLNYSDKQHRGNVGEGQFHINQKNLQYHIDTYQSHELSWESFIGLLKT